MGFIGSGAEGMGFGWNAPQKPGPAWEVACGVSP